jgi:ribonucleoside-triphosphate reductase
MDAPHNKPFGCEVAYMGCRTRVIADRHGKAISDGRGNLSFTSINLPRLALRASGGVTAFYGLLEETLTLVARQLMHRYQIQSHLKVKDMPFLMGQGLYVDSDHLQPNDDIAEAARHGTLSIGFIGLAETLTILTGSNHAQSPASRQLGLEIVGFMRQLTDYFADQYDMNFTLLATPAEGLSGRFLKIDRKVYGVIPGITDKDYYTNSFHVPVSSDISAYEKMSIEAPYHELTNAGHISYVELDAPPVNNLSAFETIVRTMGQLGVGYGGINFPIDECRLCGFSGLIDNECPKCGCGDIRRIRRITGYLSTVDRFNAAKQAELHDRHSHLH